MSAETTYSTDFNLWIQQTARLLREHRWQDIDLKNLIEEIEDLGYFQERLFPSRWRDKGWGEGG